MFERKSERPAVDTRLLPYLETQGEAATELELGRLYKNHLEKMISGALQKRTGIYLRGGESGETQVGDATAILHGVVLTSLIKRLEKIKDGKAKPIGHLNSFIYEAAKNAFFSYLAEQSPHRKKIKTQMYDYVIRPDNADGTILMWKTDADVKVYGLAEHHGNEVTFNSYYKLLIQYPGDFKAKVFSAEQLKRWKLSAGVKAVKGKLIVELLRAILKAVNGPIEVNRLADVIVQMTGGDAAGRVLNDSEDENEDFFDLSEDEGSPTEASQYADTLGAETLPLVWKEICSLHLTERRAHFLKKHYEEVILFVATGISTRQMADALKMPLLQFEELLNKLPLSNHEIAALFSANPVAIGNAATKASKSIWAKFAGFFGISKKPANEKGSA